MGRTVGERETLGQEGHNGELPRAVFFVTHDVVVLLKLPAKITKFAHSEGCCEVSHLRTVVEAISGQSSRAARSPARLQLAGQSRRGPGAAAPCPPGASLPTL